MRDGLEIRMKDRTLRIDSLPMAIRACSFRIETLSDFVLSFGRDVALVFEDEDLMGEECFTDYVKVGIWEKSVVDHQSRVVCLTRGGYRFHGYSPTI